MKKLTLVLILCFAFLFSSLCLTACDNGAPETNGGTGGGGGQQNDIEYVLSNDQTYYILSDGTNNKVANLTIPDNINGIPVKVIGEDAFEDCTTLKSVTIPSSITTIDAFAFYGCETLESVNILGGVKEILGCAFDNCTSLKNLTLPNTLEEIGARAFAYCSELKNFTLPQNVKYIGTSAFIGCDSLTEITIPASTMLIEQSFMNCANLNSIILERQTDWVEEECTYYDENGHYTGVMRYVHHAINNVDFSDSTAVANALTDDNCSVWCLDSFVRG